MTTQQLNNTQSKITKIVADVLEKDEATFTPAASLKDLGMDEFDMIKLVMKLEDEFSFIIEDKDFGYLDSVQGIVRFISDFKK